MAQAVSHQLLTAEFNPRAVYMEFGEDKAAVGQVSLLLLCFPLPVIAPSMH